MLKFRTGGAAADDSGYNELASIKPPGNGADLVNEVTSARFLGNLRQRTEAIRQAWDLGEMIAYHDRGLAIVPSAGVATTGGPTCTWDGLVPGGSGQPALSAPILVKSVGSPATNQYPEVKHTTVGVQDLRLRSSLWTGALREDRDMAAGGRNISLEMSIGAIGAPLSVTIEGAADPADGPTAVVVSLVNDGGGGCATIYDDLVLAINTAVGNTNGEVLFAEITAPDINPLAPAFVAEMATRSKLFEFATFGTGGVDSISYDVTEIAVQAEGPYYNGDMCVLDLDGQTERLIPGGGGFVKRLYGGTASLHNNTGKGAVIPLFLVKDDTLIWFNGVVCPKQIPTELVTQSGLRAELANQDNTSALGLSGTERIGGDDIVSALGPTLPAGTLYSQLELLYNTATGSIVVVDPVAGVGHFQTIAAAVTALAAADGGVIIVNPGVYTDAVNISAAHEGITIIGRDSATTILNVAGAVPLTISTDAACHIKNLTIARNNTSGEAIILDCAAPDAGLVQKFENCSVVRLGVPVGAVTLITSEAPAEFVRCNFASLSARYETVLTMATGGALLANTYFRDCRFETINKIAAEGGAANLADVLEVSDCVIANCANTNVETHLIYFNTGSVDRAFIRNNYWGAGAADDRGLFCKLLVTDEALVENNRVLRSPSSALASDQSVIHIVGGADYFQDRVVVRNNLIRSTGGVAAINCGGILVVDAHADIENNSVGAAHSRAGDQAIGFADGTACGNQISAASGLASAVYIRADLGATGMHVAILDNRLYGSISNTQIGIEIAGTATRAKVRGNTIESTNAAGTATGINCAGDDANIADNIIINVKYGVNVTAAAPGVQIVDNVIKCSSAVAARGIIMYAYGAARGNKINFTTAVQSDAIGIVGAANCRIEDNQIGQTSAPGLGISCSAISDVVMRGNIVIAATDDRDVFGIYLDAVDDCVVEANRITAAQTAGAGAFDASGIWDHTGGSWNLINGNRIDVTNANKAQNEFGIISNAPDGSVCDNVIKTTIVDTDAGRGYGIYFDAAGANHACHGNRITAETPAAENGGGAAGTNGIGDLASAILTIKGFQAWIDV